MENLLIIIAVFVIFIFQEKMKPSKKKVSDLPPPIPHSTEKPLRTEMRDGYEEEELKQKTKNTIYSFDNHAEGSLLSRVEIELQTENEIEKSEIKGEDEATEYHLNQKEELRKAMVWSEILKRKIY